MKPLTCVIGRHPWVHCRCPRCGSHRDAHHDWGGTCTCAVCGATRPMDHDRVGCACRRCGAAVHDLVPDGPAIHRCTRCDITEGHRLARQLRWEDWGGWDSIGPWRAQENEYQVCEDCGHEEHLGSTGNIQI